MKHGTYIGPEPSLKGKGALLRPSDKPGKIEAQFDDMVMRPGTGVLLGYRWHEFDEADFVEDREGDQ